MILRTTFAALVCLLFFAWTACGDDAVQFAAKLIGRPYVWGAEGPNAFDCSGLMQYVHQKVGITLPRRAIDQSRVGDSASRRLERGDLLFFATAPGESLVTHVGVYEGNNVMIDASRRHGRVRRDDLDDPFWVERFLFARRVDRTTTSGGQPGQRDREARRTPRPIDKREIVVRTAAAIAGILLRRPAR